MTGVVNQHNSRLDGLISWGHALFMEKSASTESEQPIDPPDADALMVALIMAPGTFSRNRFFQLFEDKRLRKARRRARMVRGLIKEMTEPWPLMNSSLHPVTALIECEEVVNGELRLQYSVPDMGYRRSARLSLIEAAALRYCLDRAGKLRVSELERRVVEDCLLKLAPHLAPSCP